MNNIYFSDLDLNFTIHPVTKDLVPLTNEKAIIRSVKNLVMTNHYERLFNSQIGSNVYTLLFEMLTPMTSNYVEREIKDVLTAFEPRITQLQVTSNAIPEEHALQVNIQFYIENSTTPTVVDILLERIR